ncbi:MAG: 4Fe-4S binding protein [Methanocalculus sp.]|uniref:4Fe-4S binding protein n=1 Tax=Methanocalculus sp. TaxID=2004547 RepID=UPI0027161999|nr:4Fe-4S binding protein [Methanocalculus sp.]MDO9539597.1 4Fe-4S binding protein [Methanocalculus sp.]
MDLNAYFHDEGIEIFAEVEVPTLTEKDQAYVRDFFPPAQSVIVFGREVPASAYHSTPREQTEVMLGIAETLNDTAIRLAELLRSDGIPAEHIPLYLPVRIEEGRVRGVVRLKHVAAAGGLGTIGMNTLLLHPVHGPRLLLSGVVMGKGLPAESPIHPSEISIESPSPLCIHCGRCIKACPAGAISPDGVEVFRCRTISPWVPGPFVPIAKWLIGRQMLLRCMAPIAPFIAKTATIRCSRCVTECPVFEV